MLGFKARLNQSFLSVIAREYYVCWPESESLFALGGHMDFSHNVRIIVADDIMWLDSIHEYSCNIPVNGKAERLHHKMTLTQGMARSGPEAIEDRVKCAVLD